MLTFYIKIMKKGVFLIPQTPQMTWHGRSRGAQKLTWRTGPMHGCDAALRPHGKAARGPRKAQVAGTHGRRPRGSTRTPVRGATWQGGRRVKGP